MKTINSILAVCVFFSVSAQGQDQSTGPLKLVIKASKKNVCYGESVGLTRELRNVGNNPLTVDTERIGYRTDFSWWRPVYGSRGSEGGSSTSVGHHVKDHKPSLVILQPNEVYTENRPYVFDDEILKRF